MKFFIGFFGAIMICFVLWVGIVFGQVNNPTAMGQWVEDVYNKKTKIAKDIKGEKIVIVSGSNSLFGINSKMLESSFDFPVVNYGVNAGVFLPYILYKAKGVICSGDRVIIPLEYPMYSYDGVPNTQMIDTIFSRDFDLFWQLTFKEQFLMVWSITFDRVKAGYSGYKNSPVTSGLYGAHNIDSYGDQKGNDRKYKSKAIEKELLAHKVNYYGKDFDKDALGWSYLERFVQWCEKKGAKVIFVPSTMLYFSEYKTDKKERWFYLNLPKEVENRGWKFVGDPYDYMYENQYYFNTDFHLTSQGRDKRTVKLIKDLKQLSSF